MNKNYEMKVPLSSFVGREATDEQKQQAMDFYGVDSLEGHMVDVSLKLENFLWQVFLAVKPPSSPLKIKAHEMFLSGVSGKLAASVDSADEMPKLSELEKATIKPYLEDEDKYKEIEAPFESKIGDGETKVITLPLVNVLNSLSFVTAIASLFEDEITDEK
jgi:hypothetical protein